MAACACPTPWSSLRHYATIYLSPLISPHQLDASCQAFKVCAFLTNRFFTHLTTSLLLLLPPLPPLLEMTSNLAYQDEDLHSSTQPVYLREGEDMKDEDSNEGGLKTLTRLTALGSHAGTLQNYTAEGHTILYPTPSNDTNDPL